MLQVQLHNGYAWHTIAKRKTARQSAINYSASYYKMHTSQSYPTLLMQDCFISSWNFRYLTQLR